MSKRNRRGRPGEVRGGRRERASRTSSAGVRAVAEAFGYSAEELGEHPGRGEHGPLVREPDGDGQPAAR